jgi:hypothetical protein
MCKQYQKPKRSHHPPTPLHGAAVAVARVGRKTSTRGAVAVAVAVAVANRIPPVVRVVVSHGRRTRVRARGFDWGVRACARGKFSSFVLGSFIRSFGTRRTDRRTEGSVGRLFFVFGLVVYPNNLPSGNGFAGRSTGRASDLRLGLRLALLIDKAEGIKKKQRVQSRFDPPRCVDGV